MIAAGARSATRVVVAGIALAGAVLVAAAPLAAGAQGRAVGAPGRPGAAQGQAPAEPGSSLQISVLTFGQGDAVFERFGHNALRVRDTLAGEDLAYNWGMFSFDEPQFLQRFLSGDTRYWVEAFPSAWLIDIYAQQDRESVEQVLALTPAQRLQIAAAVRANALEQNRYYRYDYFLDNCSTRLRDVLDAALQGSLKGRFTAVRTDRTFRSESVRLTAPDALAQAGIDVALGPRADQPLTAWESMFIPMRLRDHLREVTVPAPEGGTRPLVQEEILLHRATRAPELAERRGLALGALGPVLGAWMLLLAPVAVAGRRRTRIPAAVMAALWYGVTGVLGLALLGMWIGSAHVFWYENLNLLLISPLGLVAAFPVARAILRARPDRLSQLGVRGLAALAASTLILAPFVDQHLGGPIFLFLPAHLGLVVTYWRHTRAVGATPEAPGAGGAPAAPPAPAA